MPRLYFPSTAPAPAPALCTALHFHCASPAYFAQTQQEVGITTNPEGPELEPE
ncbi:predicted protein [Sclerotinia sclerotiorum 1980 UF-70]|uniref:Uncharacterized protein n=1 Tax=Sclerotinia sclerotiorum (strain ATCC 18683 / 1980 / Ss-1) TaxID=665079 RepID=A7F3P3_SCLS1|nr:predicted protein [Sclerotinia sclerotiorum 1980 UF-70]EDN97364.1 predicted protein [Sclerotinia sclerotiorum 1980 UF-70]